MTSRVDTKLLSQCTKCQAIETIKDTKTAKPKWQPSLGVFKKAQQSLCPKCRASERKNFAI